MKIAFVASPVPPAQEALLHLTQRYGCCSLDEADTIVTLGGDGVLLKTLYAVLGKSKKVYALRRTDSVGFLCNPYAVEGLPDRLHKALRVILHPLRVEARTINGETISSIAINEVTMIRQTSQSAKLRILVDGVERLNTMSGDGLLISTPAGSTAYNHSAGGPILPLTSNNLVMTAICGFRPRRWRYAVLPQSSVFDIEGLELAKRPIRIEAGTDTVQDVASARIWLDCTTAFTVLFDPDSHLGERILREQFLAD